MDFETAIATLKSRYPDYVLQALKVVSRVAFKEPGSVERHISLIKDKLHDTDEGVCAYACWTAGQIGRNRPEWYEDEIVHLFSLMNHRNEKIRENALFAIGWIGRANPSIIERDIHRIIEKHNDACPRVRLGMIWASENIANSKPDLFENYVDVFEGLLDDPDTRYVRGEAPEIFRVIGKKRPDIVKRSIGALESKLSDNCKVTRIHARGALRIIEKNLSAFAYRPD